MKSKKIMVVEDEALVARDLQRRLERAGYTVPATAASGDEAVQKAAEHQPDLILMDIRLRGRMDGIEAAKRIQKAQAVPVVFLTAFADDATVERAKATGPFGYIVKPFKEKELRITIEMALYKHVIEKKLKESEQWLSAALRSLREGVIAEDEQGLVKFMNATAEATSPRGVITSINALLSPRGVMRPARRTWGHRRGPRTAC